MPISEVVGTEVAEIELPKALKVQLPPILGPGEFERQMLKVYRRDSRGRTAVLLDFSFCTYIEVTELCYAIAYFRLRSSQKKHTRLKLPRLKSVRDFLHLWGFWDALSDATGSPKEEILTKEDIPLLDERISTYSVASKSIESLETKWVPNVRKPEDKRNFFGFMTYDLGPKQLGLFPDAKTLIPLNEATRWREPLIKAVLGRHLHMESGEEAEIARVVIYESLANAVQHPDATKIQVVSRLYHSPQAVPNKNPHSQKGSFTICVWDDGESMSETLGKALRKAGKVHYTPFPLPMYEKVLVYHKDPDGNMLENEKVIDQAAPLPVDASEDMILLACLFPGVTRRVAESVREIPRPPEQAIAPDFANIFGMGLYILTRTVVDRYGGELAVRSGRCFLNLRVAYDAVRKKSKARYIASLTSYPETSPQFKGNLLIIRIPPNKG